MTELPEDWAEALEIYADATALARALTRHHPS
jgi:hypothetical protein